MKKLSSSFQTTMTLTACYHNKCGDKQPFFISTECTHMDTMFSNYSWQGRCTAIILLDQRSFIAIGLKEVQVLGCKRHSSNVMISCTLEAQVCDLT